MTPRRYCGVPEVLSVQVVPSEEVRMVPFQPTVTNDTVVLSVLVVLDVLLLQEMMVKLKRNNEKMMSRCFTWVTNWWNRRTQYIPRFGVILQEFRILLGGGLTVKN